MTATASPSTSGKISRGLGWSTASSLVLRVGNFCVSIIMARLIAPEQFGVFAVALTVWTVLGTLAEFGLSSSLVQAQDFERRAATVATLGLVTSSLLAIGMAVGAPLIAATFNSPQSDSVLRVMSLSLFVFGFSTVQVAILHREFRQRTIFAVNGVALAASTVVLVLLAVFGWGAMALAVGQIVSQTVTVAGHFVATRRPLRLGFDRDVALESAHFCLPLAGANLVSWVLLSVDNVLVSRALGPVQLGLYVLAFNVSSWPMNAVGQAVRVVALPGFARARTAKLRGDALVRVVGPLWAVAALLGLGLAASAGAVLRLLYGDRWAAAGAALAGLAVFGAVRVVFDLFATFLVAAGQTRAVFVTQLVWLAAIVPAMYAGIRLFGLAGAGWAHLLVAVTVGLPAYLVCLNRVGVRPRAVLRATTLPTIFAVPAGALAWWAARDVDPAALSVLVAGGCALVLYVAPLSRWWMANVRLLRSADQHSSPIEMEIP